MPLQQTSGNVTSDAYGGGVAVTPVYIEDVMSTFLYTGNGATQTINNGIDLAVKGGLVWGKPRNQVSDHFWVDTARGANNWIRSNTTTAQAARATVSAFGVTGFTVDAAGGYTNDSGINYASWTFRKQPKFFDVVTYTGNSVAGRQIAHNLGSVPGCIIVKGIDAVGDQNWNVYHTSIGNGNRLILDDTIESTAAATTWNNTSPTATEFTVGASSQINFDGARYVAYLFAHDAGGFGLTGTDNVISCGSYTGNGSSTGPVVTLGYEPQWLLVKQSSSTGNWFLADTMRGFDQTSDQFLLPNSTDAEFTRTNYVKPLATGFQIVNADFDVNESGGTYIYIAIRRGPMKTPTTGTSVYGQQLNVASPTFAFSPDMVLELSQASDPTYGQWVSDRLRGSNQILKTFSTNAESSGSPFAAFNQGGKQTTWGDGWSGGYIVNGFSRAPGFFDVVCYTGTGVVTTFNHNLSVAPELIILKTRGGIGSWIVYSSPVGASKILLLNNASAASASNTAHWNDTAPTSTVFTVGTSGAANSYTSIYVAYLFASCPGVSKVGSYTGNGTTQTINCGFTGGARFVLIKRTDSTGNWYVYDTARGMTTLTDPYLLLNSTAAETATLGSVTTVSTGFAVNATILSAINTSGASYIYLSIA